MPYDLRDLFNNIYLLDYLFIKVINLQFRKYKNQLNFSNYVDANYFQILTNFIIRNKHLLQNSKYVTERRNSSGRLHFRFVN